MTVSASSPTEATPADPAEPADPTEPGDTVGGTTPLPPPPSNALPHLRGLDGLRGLAVIGVLLFHGGFTWARGGFLGVSTFFTLSGFLITNLLVREYDRRDTIDLVRFWGRRFRRLMPAALVAIAIVGVGWWIIGSPAQVASLRTDMWSAVAYVANWRFLSAGVSYAELFSAPSPLQHFWSLAIEEQFYVVFPLVVIALMRLGGRRLLATICSVAAAVSVALMVVLRGNFDRIYYGTDTRVAELLLGVLLAIWWSGRQRTRDMTTARRAPVIDVLGLVAIVAVFVAWNRVPEASSVLARGGLPVYALLTTFIIYVATRPGWTTSVLSMGWLRWAGLISYGLYLYHWPIFLWLSPERTGLSIGPLFALRMAVTIAVALVSYRFLEMPVRRGTILRTWRTALPAAVAAAMAVFVLAIAVTTNPPANTVPYATMKVGEDLTYVEEMDPSVAATDATKRTVYIIGDSGAMDLQPALGAAFASTGTTKVIYGAAPGFEIGGTIPWRTTWSEIVATENPDLVVTMFGGWDAAYIRANGIAAYERLMEEAVTILSSRGAKIVYTPIMPGGSYDFTDLNDAIRRLAGRHPGVVFSPEIDSAFVDSDGAFHRTVTLDDGTVLLLRKADNWHLCQDGAERLSARLLDQLVEIGWSSAPTPGWEDGTWRAAKAYDDPVGACIRPK